MSDTNYMNAYVNLVMETVHSNLNDILQLKTQAKLLNDLVLEKDQVISSLNEQLEKLGNVTDIAKNAETEMNKLRENAATWEFQYNNMKDKVSHMDTLVNQYNDLQNQFISQTSEFEKTTAAFVELKQQMKEYEQKNNTLTSELAATTKKLDRLAKKEDKKLSDPLPPKTIINREDTKSTPVAQKVKSVVEEKPKETDDDF